MVANCLPLTSQTRGQFNAALFEAMKPTAFFVNVGRGGTVNTADLVTALETGPDCRRGSRRHRPGAVDRGSPSVEGAQPHHHSTFCRVVGRRVGTALAALPGKPPPLCRGRAAVVGRGSGAGILSPSTVYRLGPQERAEGFRKCGAGQCDTRCSGCASASEPGTP